MHRVSQMNSLGISPDTNADCLGFKMMLAASMTYNRRRAREKAAIKRMQEREEVSLKGLCHKIMICITVYCLR